MHPYTNPTFLRSPGNRSVCANCGGHGHTYKTCGHPIISFGVICYTMCSDASSVLPYPRYLMVQRKDSMCYVEFVRGKYSLSNLGYLVTMFKSMTEAEKRGIIASPFDQIWNDMWCKAPGSAGNENSHSYNREFKDASEKFQVLSTGFIRSHSMPAADLPEDGQELACQHDAFINMQYLVDRAHQSLKETEWGFPKGRRNINEDDYNCAFREFCEETGMGDGDITARSEIRPLEEVFVGSNRIRYKHIYYTAVHQPDRSATSAVMFDPTNKVQSKEIKDVRWLSYSECQDKIPGCNNERKELLHRLDRILTSA